jgi:branched-chain amino acid transport system permease protein
LDILLQQLVSAISIGCVYGLVALGYSFVWNAAGVVNLAQGHFVMLGGFLYGITLTNKLGLSLIPATFLLVITMGLFGILAERVFYRPFSKANIRTVLVALLALGMLLANLAIIIWDPYPKGTPGPWGQKGIMIAGASILYQNIFIIVMTLILLVGQHYFFKHTIYGKYLRAVSSDKATAALIGIDTERSIALTFAYSSILAAIAGMLLAPFLAISPQLANIGFKGFGACVVGSFSSTLGAMAGGLMIGFVEQFGSFYISSAYREAIVYLVITMFLLFRPEGLFGGKKEVGSL